LKNKEVISLNSKAINMKINICYKLFYGLLILLFPFTAISQNGNTQNAAIPKDAPVNVTMTDFKGNILNNEIVIFKSKANAKEYQGLTDDKGKFSIRLPSADTYEIFILGFKDSLSYNFLEIPALKGNAYYKDPFVVDIQHLPAKSFVLEDCNFETGKSTLLPEAYPVIDELVSYLNRKDDEKIELGGHTDNVGNAAKNLKLSLDRAKAVMAYLLSKGIEQGRVTAKGYGMTKPIASNKTAAGRAQNRRTEVKILE
jgi:OmpA-OmpF porin, OOP family